VKHVVWHVNSKLPRWIQTSELVTFSYVILHSWQTVVLHTSKIWFWRLQIRARMPIELDWEKNDNEDVVIFNCTCQTWLVAVTNFKILIPGASGFTPSAWGQEREESLKTGGGLPSLYLCPHVPLPFSTPWPKVLWGRVPPEFPIFTPLLRVELRPYCILNQPRNLIECLRNKQDLRQKK
jgi:hypothetical protein